MSLCMKSHFTHRLRFPFLRFPFLRFSFVHLSFLICMYFRTPYISIRVFKQVCVSVYQLSISVIISFNISKDIPINVPGFISHGYIQNRYKHEREIHPGYISDRYIQDVISSFGYINERYIQDVISFFRRKITKLNKI